MRQRIGVKLSGRQGQRFWLIFAAAVSPKGLLMAALAPIAILWLCFALL